MFGRKKQKKPHYIVYTRHQDGSTTYLFETNNEEETKDPQMIYINETCDCQTQVEKYVKGEKTCTYIYGEPSWTPKFVMPEKKPRSYPTGKAYAEYILRDLGVPEWKWYRRKRKEDQESTPEENEDYARNIFESIAKS